MLRSRRGVAPILGTILIVGIAVVAATILYAFRPPLAPAPLKLDFQAGLAQNEPVWGDGSDCKNVNGVQTCLTLPTIAIEFTDPPTVLTSEILMVFYCNGTVYLGATLAQMAWVPGSAGTVGGTGPQLQHCGTYKPPAAAWNRFAYFDQVVAGSPVLQPGDTLVVFAHTFTSFKDDDFHGAPEWCYTVQGACTIEFIYTGFPAGVVAELPLFGLSL